jgi:hypothetical protein
MFPLLKLWDLVLIILHFPKLYSVVIKALCYKPEDRGF